MNFEQVLEQLKAGEGREAILWTRKVLAQSQKSYLTRLPVMDYRDHFQTVHGSLLDPFAYVKNYKDALLSFEKQNAQIYFIGHTHVPVIYELNGGGSINILELEKEVKLRRGARYLINVGSVGKPRDGDTRACYALWNTVTGSVWMKRVEYLQAVEAS